MNMIQMIFTEEEREYIDTEPGNWHVKDGAPEHVRATLEPKLKRIYEFAEEQEQELIRRRAKYLQQRSDKGPRNARP